MTKIYPDNVIVDEQDNVIGQMQLPEAYANGEILRASRVIVLNSNGERLLQQRGPKVYAPGRWVDAASGHVDVGESYEQAALRELHEEAGYQADENELIEVDYNFLEEHIRGMNIRHYFKVYVYRTDEQPKILDPDEVAAFEWRSTEQINQQVAEQPQDFGSDFVELHDRINKRLAAI